MYILFGCFESMTVTVAHYAASQKVAGSSPDEVDFLN
jgi:hypothetical protein